MSCDLHEKRNTLLKLAHYFRLPLQATALCDSGRLWKTWKVVCAHAVCDAFNGFHVCHIFSPSSFRIFSTGAVDISWQWLTTSQWGPEGPEVDRDTALFRIFRQALARQCSSHWLTARKRQRWCGGCCRWKREEGETKTKQFCATHSTHIKVVINVIHISNFKPSCPKHKRQNAWEFQSATTN